MPKKIQIWGKSQLNLRRKYDFFKKKVAFGQSDVPFLMGEKMDLQNEYYTALY